MVHFEHTRSKRFPSTSVPHARVYDTVKCNTTSCAAVSNLFWDKLDEIERVAEVAAVGTSISIKWYDIVSLQLGVAVLTLQDNSTPVPVRTSQLESSKRSTV